MAARAARGRPSSARRYLGCRSRHVDAAAARWDVDRHAPRSAEVLTLEHRDRRRRLDDAELAQVATERGSRGARSRILELSARRERVARVEEILRLTVNELQRRPAARGHEPSETLEVVVE